METNTAYHPLFFKAIDYRYDANRYKKNIISYEMATGLTKNLNVGIRKFVKVKINDETPNANEIFKPIYGGSNLDTLSLAMENPSTSQDCHVNVGIYEAYTLDKLDLTCTSGSCYVL